MEIQLYSHHAKALKYSQQYKVEKFIELGCVEYDQERKIFLCHPIEGYNTRTYEIRRNPEFEWECNCQGFQVKLREYRKDPATHPEPTCSHVGAVWEWLKRHNFLKVRRAVRDGLQLTLMEISDAHLSQDE